MAIYELHEFDRDKVFTGEIIPSKVVHIKFNPYEKNSVGQTVIDNNKDLKIIVEARNLEEIEEILKTEGVYRILIDNFDYENTKKAVQLIGDKCLTESSGGINEKTVRKYAECGVNYISSGALTHSVYNMDLSLKAI